MQSYLIEDASSLDVNAIARIHVDAWATNYRALMPTHVIESQTLESRQNLWTSELMKTSVVVARIGSDVVGFAAFGPARDALDATCAEVYAIYVAPVNWGQGVGRQLWSTAEDRLEANGFATVSAWVLDSNELAAKFYRRQGSIESDEVAVIERAGHALTVKRFVKQLRY